MKLSEAIMLGSSSVAPMAGAAIRYINPPTGCALGMGLFAVGKFDPIDHFVVEHAWPWLLESYPYAAFPCRCGQWLGYSENKAGVIAHLFDQHVMGKGDWTLDQLCDWVRSVEPAEDADAARVLGERDHAARGAGPASSEARAELLRVGAGA